MIFKPFGMEQKRKIFFLKYIKKNLNHHYNKCENYKLDPLKKNLKNK